MKLKDEVQSSNSEPDNGLKDLPLSTSWSFFLENSRKQAFKAGDAFLSSSMLVGVCNTVQGFWGLYNSIEASVKDDCTQEPIAVRMFKQNIQPLWEDPSNALGGKWVIECQTFDVALTIFFELLLALVGEQLPDSENVCGCVLIRRRTHSKVQIWVANQPESGDHDRFNSVFGSTLRVKVNAQFWSHELCSKRTVRSHKRADLQRTFKRIRANELAEDGMGIVRLGPQVDSSKPGINPGVPLSCSALSASDQLCGEVASDVTESTSESSYCIRDLELDESEVTSSITSSPISTSSSISRVDSRLPSPLSSNRHSFDESSSPPTATPNPSPLITPSLPTLEIASYPTPPTEPLPIFLYDAETSSYAGYVYPYVGWHTPSPTSPYPTALPTSHYLSAFSLYHPEYMPYTHTPSIPEHSQISHPSPSGMPHSIMSVPTPKSQLTSNKRSHRRQAFKQQQQLDNNKRKPHPHVHKKK